MSLYNGFKFAYLGFNYNVIRVEQIGLDARRVERSWVRKFIDRKWWRRRCVIAQVCSAFSRSTGISRTANLLTLRKSSHRELRSI